MVLNCVLHRHNLPHVDKIIEMALALDAEFLELANTQYYGWAWTNRDHLMPTQAQLIEAEAVVQRYRAEIGTRCRILFVVPDYFEERPKACMNGWGSVFLAVAPDGVALPCHNARNLPGLQLPRVQDQPLGDAWMKAPCRDCDERHKDFGGCRCQAFQITGDVVQADPVCSKSPHHDKVRAVGAAGTGRARAAHRVSHRRGVAGASPGQLSWGQGRLKLDTNFLHQIGLLRSCSMR